MVKEFEMAPPSVDLAKLVKILRKKAMTLSEIAEFCEVGTSRSAHRILEKLKDRGLELARLGSQGDYRYRILGG